MINTKNKYVKEQDMKINFRKKLIIFTLVALQLISLNITVYSQNTTKNKTEKTNSAEVKASVTSNSESTYSVILPQEIAFEKIELNKLNKFEYSVSVENKTPKKGYVEITSNKTSSIFNVDNEKYKIDYTNEFGTQKVRYDKIINSAVVLDENDVKAAISGDYKGVVTFNLKYIYSEITEPTTKPTIEPTIEPTTEPTIEPTIKPTIKPNGNNTSNPNIANGTYEAPLELRKQANFKELSMADSLFFDTADIVINGDTAQLTLFVIDPIPNYETYGTPVSDVRFTYNSKVYNASVEATNKEDKFYSADGRFLMDDGTHPSSKITVNLPVGAIKAGQNGDLLCTAYVNAVMMSTQSFYILLGETTKTSSNSYDIDSSSGNSSNGSNSNSGSGSTDVGEVQNITLTDNRYIAQVDLRRFDDINTFSMSDPLFLDMANIVVEGDKATLYLYIIDPIPNYVKEGTPLKDIVFTYDNVEYPANYAKENGMYGTFDVAAGFINEKGEYPVSTITVTMPKKAFERTQEGTLSCSAFINVVMKSTQQFYVVLNDIKVGTNELLTKDTGANGTVDNNNNSNDDENTTEVDKKSVITLKGSYTTLTTICVIIIILALLATAYFIFENFRRKRL